MRTTAMTSSSRIQHPVSIDISRISARPGLLRRFIQAVESSDWDDDLLRQEKWLNGICLGIIAFSVLYLVPLLIYKLLH
jgi:hypothetical protein